MGKPWISMSWWHGWPRFQQDGSCFPCGSPLKLSWPFLLVCYANFCWLNWLSSSNPLNFTGAVLQSPLYASHSLTFWGGWTHLERLHERLGLSPGRLCVKDDSGISILGAVTLCVIKHSNGTSPINGGVECFVAGEKHLEMRDLKKQAMFDLAFNNLQHGNGNHGAIHSPSSMISTWWFSQNS